MRLLARLLVTVVFGMAGVNAVVAVPVPSTKIEQYVSLDEVPTHRTAAVVLCMFYACLLSLAQGYRAGRTAGRKTKTRVSNVLVFVQGFICLSFLFAVGVIVSGLGLQTDKQCYAAIRVCIAMYFSAKVALTFFLLERVHIIRAPFVKRIKDPIWVIGALVTVCGYFAIMGAQFVNAISHLSRDDGICRIGIQPGAAIAVAVFDTVLNAILTFMFIWQLRPAIKSHTRRVPGLLHAHSEKRRASWPFRGDTKRETLLQTTRGNIARRNLRNMLVRNVIGSVLLLVNVVVNNAMYIRYNFAKMGHACLLMCLTDIVLGMLITHWLTMRSAESVTDSPPRGPSALSTTDGSAATTMPSRRQTLDLGSYQPDIFAKLGEKPAPVSNNRLEEDRTAILSTLR